jgi:hypothetical protein
MATFELGQLLATPGVLAAADGEDLLPSLSPGMQSKIGERSVPPTAERTKRR